MLVEKLRPIIGMRVIDAIEYLDDTQLECRIIKEDGVTHNLTQDLNENRVNIIVVSDKVDKIDGLY